MTPSTLSADRCEKCFCQIMNGFCFCGKYKPSSTSASIKVPLRLVSESNSTEHWSKKSKRHKIQKMLVNSYLNTIIIPELPICVTLTRFAPRQYDTDNLQTAFKYVRDAVSEYVIGCNIAGRADDDPRITWEYKQEKTTGKEYYITIQINQTK